LLKNLLLTVLLLGVSTGYADNRQTAQKWKPVYITTYGPGYHGNYTASGKIYDKNKISIAVPVYRKGKRMYPIHPFGSYITLKYKERTLRVMVTDLCPGGTYDLSDAGMKALLGRYESTKLRGYLLVEKPKKVKN
jgi:hypothetical protein